LTTVNGFRVTWLAQLDRARLAKEQAEENGFEVNFTSNTRLNVDKPIPKRAVVNEKPSASSKSASGLVCRGVGTPTIWWIPVDFDRASFLTRTPMHTRGRTRIRSSFRGILTFRLSLSFCCRRVNLPRHHRGPHHPSTDRNPLRVSRRLYPTSSVRCIPIIQSTTILTSLCLLHCRQAPEDEIIPRRCWIRAL
jgi:hypothetical protein